MKNVKDDRKTLVTWFKDIFSTLNAEKWHLLSKGDRVAQMFSWVHGCTLWDEDSVKLLGILIDSDWSLNKCIKMIFKKASQNHTALLSMANILTKIVNLIFFSIL